MTYTNGQTVTVAGFGRGVLLGRFTHYGGNAHWSVRFDSGVVREVSEAAFSDVQPAAEYEVDDRVVVALRGAGVVTAKTAQVDGSFLYTVQLNRQIRSDEPQFTTVPVTMLGRHG